MVQSKSIVNLSDVKGLLHENRDLLKTLIEEMVQETLEAEMEEALGSRKSERTEERVGYRSGYYNRTLITRVGKLKLRVPQGRQCRFATELFVRYQRKGLGSRSGRDVHPGCSTRKVKVLTEQLCGHSFSASSISVIVKRLDSQLQEFARRPLEEAYAYLIVDARYEKGRKSGTPRVASGIARSILTQA